MQLFTKKESPLRDTFVSPIDVSSAGHRIKICIRHMKSFIRFVLRKHFCASEANWDCSVMTMTIKTAEISCIYLPRVPLYVIASLYRQIPHVYLNGTLTLFKIVLGRWVKGAKPRQRLDFQYLFKQHGRT